MFDNVAPIQIYWIQNMSIACSRVSGKLHFYLEQSKYTSINTNWNQFILLCSNNSSTDQTLATQYVFIFEKINVCCELFRMLFTVNNDWYWQCYLNYNSFIDHMSLFMRKMPTKEKLIEIQNYSGAWRLDLCKLILIKWKQSKKYARGTYGEVLRIVDQFLLHHNDHDQKACFELNSCWG